MRQENAKKCRERERRKGEDTRTSAAEPIVTLPFALRIGNNQKVFLKMMRKGYFALQRVSKLSQMLKLNLAHARLLHLYEHAYHEISFHATNILTF